ncbi:MAG: hypothetical protein AAF242_04025 [Bacteroidota bacterium]
MAIFLKRIGKLYIFKFLRRVINRTDAQKLPPANEDLFETDQHGFLFYKGMLNNDISTIIQDERRRHEIKIIGLKSQEK